MLKASPIQQISDTAHWAAQRRQDGLGHADDVWQAAGFGRADEVGAGPGLARHVLGEELRRTGRA